MFGQVAVNVLTDFLAKAARGPVDFPLVTATHDAA